MRPTYRAACTRGPRIRSRRGTRPPESAFTHPRIPKETTVDRRPIGIAMNGVTGRMGYHQHLVRSIMAIREQGGFPLPDGSLGYPEPLLVGRDEAKLRRLAERHSLTRWTTSLSEAL